MIGNEIEIHAKLKDNSYSVEYLEKRIILFFKILMNTELVHMKRLGQEPLWREILVNVENKETLANFGISFFSKERLKDRCTSFSIGAMNQPAGYFLIDNVENLCCELSKIDFIEFVVYAFDSEYSSEKILDTIKNEGTHESIRRVFICES